MKTFSNVLAGSAVAWIVAGVVLATPFMSISATAATVRPAVHAGAPVPIAWGLNNPRGLTFGPDGSLYIAEGGVGGSNVSPQQKPNCWVDPLSVGPYSGDTTGSRILKLDPNGTMTTFVDNLPSSQTDAESGSLVSGVADMAFIGNTMYAVLAGAGCSHGVPSIPNGVIRVNPDHSWTMIANLSAFQQANPVAHPEEDDFEPDGTWYSMIAVRGDLYAVEPNHGEIVKVTPAGKITRVIDISASQGHVVPTALSYHGNFYVGNLGVFPQAPGSSSIWKVTPSGQIKYDTRGFNMVLGLAFDNRDRMYVLEMSSAFPGWNGLPAPMSGRVVRISPNGKTRDIIADGLFLPSGMTIGPDGNVYVSNVGFGLPPIGAGEILKIEVLD
jgi:hypothetical protein